jgi:DNA-binding CsgD family transcriptional regulator
VNAWQILWQELNTRLHRKRIFMMDVKAYESLRLVAQHQKRSPQEMASQLFDQAAQGQNDQSRAMQCWDQLSPRQKQVAAYVCRGDTTRQIAAQLNISETTVKSHVKIILYKFNINSRSALRLLLAPWDLSSYL